VRSYERIRYCILVAICFAALRLLDIFLLHSISASLHYFFALARRHHLTCILACWAPPVIPEAL